MGHKGKKNESAYPYPNGILQIYEVKGVIDEEFRKDVLKDLMSTFRTSDFLMKMVNMYSKVASVRNMDLGMISYQDRFIVCYLNGLRTKTAYEIFSIGQSLETSLMEYGYVVIDNSAANSMCIIQTECVSSFKPLAKCMPISSGFDRKRLMDNLRRLAEKKVFVKGGAIYYNQQNGAFRLFNYDKITLEPDAGKDRTDNYLRAYYRYLYPETKTEEPEQTEEYDDEENK